MQVHPLKALKDNYNFVLRDEVQEKTYVVDPSGLDPCHSFLKTRNWKLDGILCTHHHWDHTDGNLDLQNIYSCPVYAHESDRKRTPGFSHGLMDGQRLSLGSLECQVLHIPGHTSGQVAFWFESQRTVFVGDTLFGFGCGRVFEGSYEQMFQSLQRLARLPEDTLIYCGHEYTLRNLEFCLKMDPENLELKKVQGQLMSLVEKNQTSLPLALSAQLRYNPFLTNDLEKFCHLRDQRNAF